MSCTIRPSPRSLKDRIQRLFCLKHNYGTYWRCVYERVVSSLVYAALSIHKH
jgi:hypothetical protein